MGQEDSENNLGFFYGSNKKKVIIQKTSSCYSFDKIALLKQSLNHFRTKSSQNIKIRNSSTFKQQSKFRKEFNKSFIKEASVIAIPLNENYQSRSDVETSNQSLSRKKPDSILHIRRRLKKSAEKLKMQYAMKSNNYLSNEQIETKYKSKLPDFQKIDHIRSRKLSFNGFAHCDPPKKKRFLSHLVESSQKDFSLYRSCDLLEKDKKALESIAINYINKIEEIGKKTASNLDYKKRPSAAPKINNSNISVCPNFSYNSHTRLKSNIRISNPSKASVNHSNIRFNDKVSDVNGSFSNTKTSHSQFKLIPVESTANLPAIEIVIGKVEDQEQPPSKDISKKQGSVHKGLALTSTHKFMEDLSDEEMIMKNGKFTANLNRLPYNNEGLDDKQLHPKADEDEVAANQNQSSHVSDKNNHLVSSRQKMLLKTKKEEKSVNGIENKSLVQNQPKPIKSKEHQIKVQKIEEDKRDIENDNGKGNNDEIKGDDVKVDESKSHDDDNAKTEDVLEPDEEDSESSSDDEVSDTFMNFPNSEFLETDFPKSKQFSTLERHRVVIFGESSLNLQVPYYESSDNQRFEAVANMVAVDNVIEEDENEGEYRNFAIIDPSELKLNAYDFEVTSSQSTLKGAGKGFIYKQPLVSQLLAFPKLKNFQKIKKPDVGCEALSYRKGHEKELGRNLMKLESYERKIKQDMSSRINLRGRFNFKDFICRYELPHDLNQLIGMSPITYITNYCMIPPRRSRLYETVFKNQIEKRQSECIDRNESFSLHPELYKLVSGGVKSILGSVRTRTNMEVDLHCLVQRTYNNHKFILGPNQCEANLKKDSKKSTRSGDKLSKTELLNGLYEIHFGKIKNEIIEDMLRMLRVNDDQIDLEVDLKLFSAVCATMERIFPFHFYKQDKSIRCRDTVFGNVMNYFNLNSEIDLEKLTSGLRQLFTILLNF